MKSIVITAENTAPGFNDVFLEYAQSRGFVIDAARVATPTDKPRVERVVQYVQKNFFAGEEFIDLADCRVRAETWSAPRPGCASTGRPSVVPSRLRGESCHCSLPCPPHRSHSQVVRAKVHRDFHVEVDKAILLGSHSWWGERSRHDATRTRQAVLERRADQGPSPQSPRSALNRPRRHAERQGDLRHP